MPITTMHKDDLAESGKHKVRTSWQIASVQAEPKSEGVCCASDCQLRFCIFAPDA